MAGGDNAYSKWGEKRMEEEVSVRTVDCLRGRLLAERVASRNAKEEAEKLGNKLMEVERLLEQEAKSRNRAEKKLKFLLKKLESRNISYASDESERSNLVDKSDISSVSSSASSSITEVQEINGNQQMKIFKINESQHNVKSQNRAGNSLQKDSQNWDLTLLDDTSASEGSLGSSFEVYLPGQECEMGANKDSRSPLVAQIFEQNPAQNVMAEDALLSAGGAHCEKSNQLGCNQGHNDSKIGEESFRSGEEGLNQEDDQDLDSQVDYSMALVPVHQPQEVHTLDPEVLDAKVKDVLNALAQAKEQLRSSMEGRRASMIRVG